MKKILFIIFCFAISSRTSPCSQQTDRELKCLFIEASNNLAPEYLGIYFSNHTKELKECLSELNEFRRIEKNEDCKPFDYVIHHKRVYEIQGETKEYNYLLSTVLKVCAPVQREQRGLIIYCTHVDQEADQNYIDEMKQLIQTGWPVIINCHSWPFTESLLQAFPQANNFVSIASKKETSLYRNILLIGEIGIFFGFLYWVFISHNWHKS